MSVTNTPTNPEPTCPKCGGTGKQRCSCGLGERCVQALPCGACGGSGRVVPERPPTPTGHAFAGDGPFCGVCDETESHDNHTGHRDHLR